MDLKMLFKQNEDYIIQMRRWFHQHPEVSLKEEKTAQRIREELEKMGIPVHPLLPNHGLVAVIKGGKPGKTIVLRADIDALPVKEETGLPFSSENEGVMHACGHDAHIAMLLGAAKTLNSVKDDLKGTVLCLFQVAEEIGKGCDEALAYLKSIGGVDAVIGLHIWSTLPEGEILLLPGAVFAGGIGFTAQVNGQGGHGARPDLVKDPIKAACDLVLKFASIPSNFYDVLDHSVVSVGKFEAGTAGNIFPSVAKFLGTIRFYKPDGGEKISAAMLRMAKGVGESYGVHCDISFQGGVIPVMCNPEMIAQARSLVENVEGLKVSPQTDPICAGDNFGFILREYPGFYGILGAGAKEGLAYPQHHCQFDVDEKALRKGAEFMANYAVDFLNK